jgi:type VI secretion system secreted protein VgrG
MSSTMNRQANMSQDDRPFAMMGLNSEWNLLSVSGEEGLSQMFEYRCEVVCSEIGDDLGSMLGTTPHLIIRLPDGSTRFVHGVVTGCEYLDVEGDMHHAVITLRPWLWTLQFETDCRIFQNMPVDAIVRQVCADCGHTDIRLDLSGSYTEREYCVQYRESVSDFVCRLLEDEGIHYHFEHSDSSHTMVLSDTNLSHSSLGNLAYAAPDAGGRYRDGSVFEWHYARSYKSGEYTLRDYDFTNPTADLTAEASRPLDISVDGRRRYDYPGTFTDSAVGANYATVRLEECQLGHRIATAVTNHKLVAAGALFTLEGHPLESENKEHFVLHTSVWMSNPEYLSGGGSGGPEYRCRMTLVESTLQFRPARVTPRPVVSGVQSAVVVGKSGDEIHTDDHGRVKLHFHWDRYDSRNEQSSCWVRVAQVWAGNRWGGIWIPRVGDEVIVEFLEGDPDRPLVIGSVYNGRNRTPYSLPANATQSGILTNSSKDGNQTTFNELRFEDKAGEEHVYFHAEKDFERVVENDDTLKVGFDKMDPGDQTVDIYNNRTVTLEAGNDTLEIKQGNCSLNIKMGNRAIKIDAGKSTTEAAQSIELKVGGSTIKLTPASIEIKSAMITIEASGLAQLKAGGTTIVKGGVVLIN